MIVSMNKEYMTFDGRTVRIYDTDTGGLFPIHGAIKNGIEWSTCSWTSEGEMCMGSNRSKNDLVEIKSRITGSVWINIYPDHIVRSHPDATTANQCRGKDCVAIIELPYDLEEGDGLE